MHQKDFITLYDGLKHKLYRYALRMLGSEPAAEDLVQEVSLKLWRSRSKLTNINNIEAWAIQLCKNQFIDICRTQGRKTTYTLNEQLDTPTLVPIHAQLEAKDELDWIHRFIQRLPDAQREVFQLREIEGMQYAEIALATGFSESKVKVYLHRSRKAIKAFLEQQHAFQSGSQDLE